MVENLHDELQRAASAKRKNTLTVLAFCSLIAVLFALPLAVKFILVIESSSRFDLRSYDVTFEEGSGFRVSDRLFVLSDTARITVKYAGHYPVSASISSSVGTLNLEPKPLPGFLSLKDPSEISEALVDGVSVLDILSSRALTLSAGYHDLQLTNLKCGVYSTRFQVLPEKTSVVEPVFGLVPTTVAITSDPPGAEVLACGEVIGTTPLQGSYALPTERLLIRKAGFKSEDIRSAVATVKLSPSTLIPIELYPKGGLLSGSLHSLKDNTLEVKDRLPVTLTYEAVGFHSKEVRISSSDTIVRLVLEKVIAPVNVSSNVQSNVFLDDSFVGRSPLTLSLEYGKHRISARAPGYASVERVLVVRSAEAISSHFELETLSSYRLKNSPPEYVPKGLSSKVVRIAASGFETGSKPGERGAAPNEVRKNVSFSREFYMGAAEVSKAEYASFASNIAASELPITGISWFDAARFCNWLSAKNDLSDFYLFDDQGKYSGVDKESLGFRLPTEAEWEYVAGRHKRPVKTVFVWGNEYRITSAAGNIADDSAKAISKAHVTTYTDGYPELSPVTSGDNVRGFFNLSGNAAEWVSDTYVLKYPNMGELVDPLETIVTGSHTVKGSSFLSSDWGELRVAFRDSLVGSREDVGFRVARYVD